MIARSVFFGLAGAALIAVTGSAETVKYDAKPGVSAVAKRSISLRLRRDISVKDLQLIPLRGNDDTTAAPWVGVNWTCKINPDTGFEDCDEVLVFCPKPGEEGCWTVQ